jgi:hypothetical protein
MPFDVFFDYTCGFSYRCQQWLDPLDLPVTWRPFSLLEAKRHDDGPAVWERDDTADNISLTALALHEAVRAQGADVDGFRRRMFSAWHRGERRLHLDDVVALAVEAGLVRHALDLASARAAVGREHEGGVARGVFGTPTLAVGDASSFVKLDAVPESTDEGEALLRLVLSFTKQPALVELKKR